VQNVLEYPDGLVEWTDYGRTGAVAGAVVAFVEDIVIVIANRVAGHIVVGAAVLVAEIAA